MPAPLALVLLTGPGTDAEEARATVAAARVELGDAPVLALGAGAEAAGLTAAAPAEILAAADVLAFLRPGDRWRPGTLAHRQRPFAGRPDAVLGVAGHALVGPDGREVVVVPPPMPPFSPDQLLLRPSIEPAAVLLRTVKLDPVAIELLALPHGDAITWSRLTAEHGLVPSWETAADVPIDPARHGTDAARTTATLWAAVRGPEADRPGGSMVRRELLRRLYLDADPAAGPVDLAELLSDDPARAAAVVADLQWTLERQREALAAERVPWPSGHVPPEDEISIAGAPDALSAAKEVEWLHREVALRDRQVEHLHAEVRWRDATIATLRGQEPGA